MKKILYLGIDIGSTTAKAAVMDENGKLLYSRYERHFSDVRGAAGDIIEEIEERYKGFEFCIAMSGSAGMSVADLICVPFVQEVIACSKAVESLIPGTSVAIELGGEDAKITFFEDGAVDQRMNGICAGGTGAFIDQMAALLMTDAKGLDRMAGSKKHVYNIAARCGVFAKTDIQALLNEGASREDIAASVLGAVARQVVTGLSCGKKISKNVALLGGPFHFLPQLSKAFEDILDRDCSISVPQNSQLFVCMGAAMISKEYDIQNLNGLAEKLRHSKALPERESQRLPALFESEYEYSRFKERHERANALISNSGKKTGEFYLGIDSGSTTAKLVLLDEELNIAYSRYSGNEGSPVETVRRMLIEIYSRFGDDISIASAAVTGYGEELIKNAFGIDTGEVETVAHYKAAEFFRPDVDFIVDIGGQDMKCISISNGAVERIMLNEACSSGCGSFIETFAKSLGMDIDGFTQAALRSKSPVDLGSRCTVFMNSRVKQAQKEGAAIEDIAAGLSYSVVKNAIYKVMKVKDMDEIGESIVVQGGTFLNDAILRCFEKATGKDVLRTPISGVMGAFGAALIARERRKAQGLSGIISKGELESLNVQSRMKKCGGCTNNCMLNIYRFGGERIFIAGNRCERPLGRAASCMDSMNMFKYKLERIFSYTPLDEKDAPFGCIGIPRVLNMYENYPFWFTFFTELGFRVELSDPSSSEMYSLGIETIPSDTVCYPAKLVHGHVENLIDKGISTIFYPCIMKEEKETEKAQDSYNCPVVTSYPELIKNNVDRLEEAGVEFISPFIPYDDKERLIGRMYRSLIRFGIPMSKIREAVKRASKEDERVKQDIRRQGELILSRMKIQGKKGIVIAGRPYHIDPHINHGIDEIVTSLGMPVLTEDSIAHLSRGECSLRVVDQWMYHSRLYKAAQVAAQTEGLEFVQLTSFGCGIDAITSDQVDEILKSAGKICTLIKMDEGINMGAVKIRLRSMKAAMDSVHSGRIKAVGTDTAIERPIFTRDMKKTHTILCPQMSPIHFEFIESAFRSEGYRLKVLRDCTNEVIEEGLKYVNNDACYPAIIVIGQIIRALKSGLYDKAGTSVIISQTGGGCRATNYISLLKKALSDSGFGEVPVISLNTIGIDRQPGFKITPSLAKKALTGIIYADLISSLALRTRPYEKQKGDTDSLVRKWIGICRMSVKKALAADFKNDIRDMIDEFENIEIGICSKPRIAVVGEILVNYHPLANNNIVEIIEAEGAEAVLPNLADFILYTMYNGIYKSRMLSGRFSDSIKSVFIINAMESLRDSVRKALKNRQRFDSPCDIYTIARKASKLVSLGNQTGEGWLLTGEIAKYAQTGIKNVICLQPFGCLPNHITGKGMMKELKRRFAPLNIVAVDYDPGASEVNQLNRIRLMIQNAMRAGENDIEGACAKEDSAGRREPAFLKLGI